MEQSIIYEVSEILDTFNMEEIYKLLEDQLDIRNEGDMLYHNTDHFKSLYYKYCSIVKTEENTEEIKQEATTRFMDICNLFLQMICKKFNLEIDDKWLDNHYNDIPGFTMAMYNFFILDLESNICEVCVNFIKQNKDYVFKAFEDRKTKKDAFTLSNKKLMPIEDVVILSNIYDVTTWVLSQLTEETYIDNISPDYLPLKLIKELFVQGIVSGEFMVGINDIYAENINLKADIALKIVNDLKKTIVPKEK